MAPDQRGLVPDNGQMSSRPVLFVSATVALLLLTAPVARAAPSYKNCTELHTTYPHGIGRANAHDKTSGRPVTSFKKDTAGYNKAIQAKPDLDRDKDGIACEKA